MTVYGTCPAPHFAWKELGTMGPPTKLVVPSRALRATVQDARQLPTPTPHPLYPFSIPVSSCLRQSLFPLLYSCCVAAMLLLQCHLSRQELRHTLTCTPTATHRSPPLPTAPTRGPCRASGVGAVCLNVLPARCYPPPPTPQRSNFSSTFEDSAHLISFFRCHQQQQRRRGETSHWILDPSR